MTMKRIIMAMIAFITIFTMIAATKSSVKFKEGDHIIYNDAYFGPNTKAIIKKIDRRGKLTIDIYKDDQKKWEITIEPSMHPEIILDEEYYKSHPEE